MQFNYVEYYAIKCRRCLDVLLQSSYNNFLKMKSNVWALNGAKKFDISDI